MSARDTIRAYYDALRAGDPLGPFFAPEDAAETAVAGERDAGGERHVPGARVKFGISERLVGTDAIVAGLRDQTATTTDWTVESRDLRVSARDCHAWFADDVFMGWTDTERDRRHEFDTRWSGTLEAVPHAAAGGGDDHAAPSTGQGEPPRDHEWLFVGMHVSTAGDL